MKDTAISEGARRGMADVAGWQAVLDRNRALFAPLSDGARIGLVSRGGADGPVSDLDGPMLVWAVTRQGARAEAAAFSGFQEAGVDLLLVADDAILAGLHARLADDALPDLVKRINRKEVAVFYLRARGELDDLGYEELFDELGISFMGACR
ncbi:MAG: hypothetical protein QGI63_05080 [Rhodospirillales bacterium]|jgi:hypothetical protein|nr:hypothetical protein [Rhodospirillales bacterium]